MQLVTGFLSAIGRIWAKGFNLLTKESHAPRHWVKIR